MPDVPERDVTRSEEADNARPRAFTEAPRRPASCGRTENHLAHSYGEHRWCTGASPYDLTEAASELHEAPAADPEAPREREGVDYHWGPDPSHGGLCKHVGPRETCPGPDCEDEPATPPGRSAGEIKAAIEGVIKDCFRRHENMQTVVNEIMRDVVGPLIAERDDARRQEANQRKRAQEAEAHLARVEKYHEEQNGLAGLAERDAEIVEQRQRAERAEADRDALFEQNGEFQTDLAVATRTVADRDATIVELEGQAARLATAKDTFADELAKAQEASVADAEIIGRLREADARVRKAAPAIVPDPLMRHVLLNVLDGGSCDCPACRHHAAVLAALDGTDGGGK